MTRARMLHSCICVLTHFLNKPTCTREHDNPLIKNDWALNGHLCKHDRCAMYIVLRFSGNNRIFRFNVA